ncbi:chymotrypsin-2-like [Eupeodes corollae]|uniref:chymotrypsin-2-like n=1 Tax=Eupeodes corollae TaxID=290404 RepID=UPI0024935FD8|nr:chymotrypsin-2-like [Eupeodes corollae]
MLKNQRLLKSVTLILSLICVTIFPTANGQSRISGGDEVKPNEIKFQASVRVYDQHVCGGTIISSKHILTAAHCLDGLGFEEPFDDLSVVTGGLKLLDTRNQHTVADITVHEGFLNGLQDSWINDIAIITLQDEIDFDETQAPADLPTEPISNDLSGIVIGWGRQDFANSYLAKTLRKATLKVLTSEECQPTMKAKIYPSQICGFAGKNIGICKGDSGGPLVVDNTVVGISSWNVPCATGVPDVFTNVYNYLDFINEVMAKSK